MYVYLYKLNHFEILNGFVYARRDVITPPKHKRMKKATTVDRCIGPDK